MDTPREAPWWQRGAVYQIYPRSFCDANGDGVGDLEGIRQRLGYLAWLGVDAVWLSPIYPSPMADFGYDIADHCDVDPLFGTLDDFDRLLQDAHRLGIRLILDWVPNHTSDRHPWFVESRSSRQSPRRDWYIWRDTPNNWTQAFTDRPAWTFDERTGQHYLHLFLPQQPDLNWAHPRVQEAMHGVLRFWLDRGVDGFRADVIHLIGKDPALPDDPPEVMGTSRVGRHHHPGTHELLRAIRGVLEGYAGERMIVGEINLTEHELIASYYGDGSQLHLAFNFVPLYGEWDAEVWRGIVTDIHRVYEPAGAWPTWVLSNHDQVRHRTRYGGSEPRARAAAVLLLTLRGTPFLYAGEELGLDNATVPPHRQVDPGGRDGCRAPIPWEATPPHGWTGRDPWLPWPPEPDRRNRERLSEDPASILHLYRRLLAARRSSPALQVGAFALLDDVPEGVLAYVRTLDDERRCVVVNFTDQPLGVELVGDWVVDIATDGHGEGRAYAGWVGSNQALLLR
jgi:alpha-glucosidase